MTTTPIADLQADFRSLLAAAADVHAGDVHIRLDGSQARVAAMVRGQVVPVTDWPVERCEAYLAAVFALCDKADAYVHGSARSMRMTGERLALPGGVSGCMVQFLPPADGDRVLVVRLNYVGDACCGSCGG